MDSPTTLEREALVAYLLSQWRRSAIAAFPQGITVPDPGHGQDEISPIVFDWSPVDPTSDDDMAPFMGRDISGFDDSGSWREGTGYLSIDIMPDGSPEVVTPGARPEVQADNMLKITHCLPTQMGPKLAERYAGLIAMLFRYVSITVGEGDDSYYIRNLYPPPERAEPLGDDGAFSYWEQMVPMVSIYCLPIAGEAASEPDPPASRTITVPLVEASGVTAPRNHTALQTAEFSTLVDGETGNFDSGFESVSTQERMEYEYPRFLIHDSLEPLRVGQPVSLTGVIFAVPGVTTAIVLNDDGPRVGFLPSIFYAGVPSGIYPVLAEADATPVLSLTIDKLADDVISVPNGLLEELSLWPVLAGTQLTIETGGTPAAPYEAP